MNICVLSLIGIRPLSTEISRHTDGRPVLYHVISITPCRAVPGFGVIRIDPHRFLARYRKRELNQHLVVLVSLSYGKFC